MCANSFNFSYLKSKIKSMYMTIWKVCLFIKYLSHTVLIDMILNIQDKKTSNFILSSWDLEGSQKEEGFVKTARLKDPVAIFLPCVFKHCLLFGTSAFRGSTQRSFGWIHHLLLAPQWFPRVLQEYFQWL